MSTILAQIMERISADGKRRCRTCLSDWARAKYWQKKESAA